MKNILIALGLVFLASASYAQESYNVPAGVVANMAVQIQEDNARTCLRLSKPTAVLTESCTQAQACVNASAVGGASCTPAQAQAVNARIYASTQPGREEWLQFGLLVPVLQDRKPQVRARQKAKECAGWEVASAAQKNARCAAANAIDPTVPATVAAGCDLGCQ